jgi:hypothetical protein
MKPGDPPQNPLISAQSGGIPIMPLVPGGDIRGIRSLPTRPGLREHLMTRRERLHFWI